MADMSYEELQKVKKLNLSDIKIISTTGTPSGTMVLCNGIELQGIKSIRFEINTSEIVGKVFMEVYTKDVMIDAKGVEIEKIEVKKEGE